MKATAMVTCALVACGGHPIEADIAAFGREAQKRGVTLPVDPSSFAMEVSGPIDTDDGHRWGGECYADQKKLVFVDDYFSYGGFSDEQKRATVFHLLGHCVFSAQHDWFKDTENQWESLMAPQLISEPQLSAHEDAYYDQLFFEAPNNHFIYVWPKP